MYHPLLHIHRTILRGKGGGEKKPLPMYHLMQLLLEPKSSESTTLNTDVYLPFPLPLHPPMPSTPMNPGILTSLCFLSLATKAVEYHLHWNKMNT